MKTIENMSKERFMSDIPRETARSAFSNLSHSPEKRGDSAVNGYAETMAADYAMFQNMIANKPELQETLDTEFERYRQGYRERTMDYLRSNARCASWFITGPANFPVARMEKRNRIAHRRANDLIEFRKRAIAAITKTLCPELRPIMAGDANAVESLEVKIAEAEKLKEEMKGANIAFKAFKADPASLDYSTLSDEMKKIVRNYIPNHTADFVRLYPVPFMPFSITNLSANIRRMKQRLEGLKRDKAAPVVEKQSENGVRLEDCPADNRIRLFFPGKPEFEVRAKLKSNGFRWSPTVGAWQAYRNHNSLTVAQLMVT
jgi:hypothetical protein